MSEQLVHIIISLNIIILAVVFHVVNRRVWDKLDDLSRKVDYLVRKDREK